MNRRDFVKSATSVMAAPALIKTARAQTVAIIGAGAAGMTAAWRLKRAGVQVKLFEAGSRWGGRVLRDDTLADFPIDLGAEWIHTDATVLGDIIDAGPTDLGVETIEYRPQTYKLWYKNRFYDRNFLRHGYAEVKFHRTTWAGYFERFMLPDIEDDLVLNAAVTDIDWSGDQIVLRFADGAKFEADRVITTVPASMLQQEKIRFHPALPERATSGLNAVTFGEGFKVFIRFSERFYPDIIAEGPMRKAMADSWTDKTYYDAAFGKDAQAHVLGLFNASQTPLARTRLSDADLLEDVLNELTTMFGATPRETLIDARVQNWSGEPYIGGSYSMDIAGGRDPADFLRPVDGKLYFAGELLGGDNQSTVHGAAFSGKHAAELVVG